VFYYDVMIVFEQAKFGGLPEDFDRWDLRDPDGWTIAHWAITRGPLPASFNQWELADNLGRMVAHLGARMDHLPADFDRWDLADNDGVTVAEVAAKAAAAANTRPTGYLR